jgi:hypothetical protein
LANDTHQAESASLHASTSFSNTLAHLGGLVRLALREVEGEAIDSDDEDDIKNSDPFEAEGYRVGSPSGLGPSSHTTASPKSTTGTKRAKTGYGSAPSRDPRWYGTGGYTGMQGDPEAEKAERALQVRTEEERLRKENETLRELLRISSDVTPEIAREFGIEIPAPPAPASWPKLGANAGKLSLGKARGSRKSIVEANSSAKAGEAEPEEGSQSSNWTKQPENAETHEEPKDVGGSSSLSISNAEEVIESSEVSKAEKITPSHVVQGSGGPPQLTSDAADDDKRLAKSGIVVSSLIDISDTEEVKGAKAVDEEKSEGEEIAAERPISEGATESAEQMEGLKEEEGLRLQTSGMEVTASQNLLD